MLIDRVGLTPRMDHRPRTVGRKAARRDARAHPAAAALAVRRANRQFRSGDGRLGRRAAPRTARLHDTILVVVTHSASWRHSSRIR